jgi:hypothetical protein
MDSNQCEFDKFVVPDFVCDEFGENRKKECEIPKFVSKI